MLVIHLSVLFNLYSFVILHITMHNRTKTHDGAIWFYFFLQQLRCYLHSVYEIFFLSCKFYTFLWGNINSCNTFYGRSFNVMLWTYFLNMLYIHTCGSNVSYLITVFISCCVLFTIMHLRLVLSFIRIWLFNTKNFVMQSLNMLFNVVVFIK